MVSSFRKGGYEEIIWRIYSSSRKMKWREREREREREENHDNNIVQNFWLSLFQIWPNQQTANPKKRKSLEILNQRMQWIWIWIFDMSLLLQNTYFFVCVCLCVGVFM